MAGGNSYADMEQMMVNMNSKELEAMLSPFAGGDVFSAVRTLGAEGQGEGQEIQISRGDSAQ